jgi:hypothetical protein
VPAVDGLSLGLVLLAATAHATWNLLARRAEEKLALYLLTLPVRTARCPFECGITAVMRR